MGHLLIKAVLFTIELNNKLLFEADEIYDIVPKRMLSPKAMPTQWLAIDRLPENPLGIGLVSAQAPCTFIGHV
jgi:hypothetical protein